MDIKELENKIFHEKSLDTKDNWLSLFDHYSAIYLTLNAKEKQKLYFKINYFIIRAYKAGKNTKQDLEKYIALLKKFPGKPRDMSKIIGEYQTLTGGEPQTIATKLSHISVEAATITVSDFGYKGHSDIPSSDDFSRALLDDINQGQAIHCSTGGDGTYDIILRCVNSIEPSANAKEYWAIRESGPVAIISVPSGEVAVTEMGFNIDKADLKIKVKPGNYKVAIYSKEIKDKFYGYLIVICPTNLPAVNQFREILSVE